MLITLGTSYSPWIGVLQFGQEVIVSALHSGQKLDRWAALWILDVITWPLLQTCAVR